MPGGSLLQRMIAQLYRPGAIAAFGRHPKQASKHHPMRFESLEARLLLSAGEVLAVPPSHLREEVASLGLAGVFEQNVGQADDEVNFIARGFGYELALTSHEVIIDFDARAANASPANDALPDLAPLRIQWLDAQAPRSVGGADPQKAVVNYLDTADPQRSVVGVPIFGEVHYEDVYDGIDLRFYERDGFMEFDWIVEAGADPNDIRLGYDGASDLSLDASRQLLIATSRGALVQRAPVLFQTIDGERVAVEGAYRIDSEGVVSLEVGHYDLARPLVIDPVLDFQLLVDGNDLDSIAGVVTDATGAIYVTGSTNSLDFPVTPGAFQEVFAPPSRTNDAAFVTKIDPDGTIVWSTYIGRANTDPDRIVQLEGVDLALDAEGNVYIAGSQFDETLFASEFNGNDNIWIAKLDSTGAFLHYDAVIPGKGSDFGAGPHADDIATSITVDADGRAYVSGFTSSTDLPVTVDAADDTLGEGGDPDQFDAFLAILAPNGEVSQLTYLGGSQNDFAWGIELDELGNVVIGGSTASPDFFVTPGAVRQANVSQDGQIRADGFVSIFDPIQRRYAYSTLLGGGLDDFVNAIDVSGGDVYLAGTTSSGDFPIVGEGLTTPVGGDESAFVARLSPKLSEPESTALVFATILGGSDPDAASAITVDASGQIHLGGRTLSRDFPLVDPHKSQIGETATGPQWDGFVARLSADGAHLIFSTYVGNEDGNLEDLITGIAADPSGRTIVAGSSVVNFLGQTEHSFIAAFGVRSVVIGRSFDISVGVPFTGVVATFDVVNPLLEAEHYEATIDWGDGTTSPGELIKRTGFGTFGSDAFEVIGTHTYSELGAYPIVVRVAGLQSDGPVSNINVSQFPGSQSEPLVARDVRFPLASSQPLFLTALDESLLVGEDVAGLFTAQSRDGGRTWSPRIIADGSDGLPNARSIGASAFGTIGGIILAYAGADGNSVVATVSRDGGQTFGDATELFSAGTGAPSGAAIGSIAVAAPPVVGPVSFWVAFNDLDQNVVHAIAVRETFGGLEVIEDHTIHVVADGHIPGPVSIAIGPDGHVALFWQESTGPGAASGSVYVATHDGVGFHTFSAPIRLGTTRFPVPELLGPAFQLTWDVGGESPHRGRLYAAGYDIGEIPGDPPVNRGLDVFVLYSDDHGATWSSPVVVNDDETSAAQFLPSVAIDPLSGQVAVGWYDARESEGDEETRYYVAVSTDGAQTFGANVAVSSALSDANNPDLTDIGFALGRGRLSSLAFNAGVLTPVWADNGLSVIGRSDPPHYEILTAVIGVASVSVAPVQIRPNGIDVILDESFSGQVATFTHNDPTRTPDEFEALVSWGDDPAVLTGGEITQPDGPGTPFVVTGTHSYERTGAFPLQVAIRDLTNDVLATPSSNVTARPGSQTQGSIAIDPTNPDRVVAVGADADGVVVSVSGDGGATWSSRLLDATQLPPGFSADGLFDPVIAFDRFGNLYMAVVDIVENATLLLASADGGALFDHFLGIAPPALGNPPVLATGPGTGGFGDTVWFGVELLLVSEEQTNSMLFEVVHVPVFGRGLFGDSSTVQLVEPAAVDVPGTFQLGDIEVGPYGEVVLSYLTPGFSDGGVTAVMSMVDPDGLGPAPFEAALIGTTGTGGFQLIPPQDALGISARPRLAWDRAGDSSHFYRLYAVFTTTPIGAASHATTPAISWSDDGGRTWELEPALLDTAYPDRFGFYPDVAVDQASGAVAAGWYGFSEADGMESTRYHVSTFRDVDILESAAVTVSPGLTTASTPSQDELARFTQYGRFSSLALAGGVVQPIWSDGSNRLGGEGDAPRFELASARLGVARVTPEPLTFLPIEQEVVEGKVQRIEFARFIDPQPGPLELYHAEILLTVGVETQTIVGLVLQESNGVYSIAADAAPPLKGDYDYVVLINTPSGKDVTSGTLHIEDALVILIGLSERVIQNEPFSASVAKMFDANIFSNASQFSAAIDWGDGTQSAGAFLQAVFEGDVQRYTIIGDHVYTEERPYEISIVVTENDGTMFTASGVITSRDPGLTPSGKSFGGALQGVSIGEAILGIFSTASPDPSPLFDISPLQTGLAATGIPVLDTDVDAYSAQIDWGDGTPAESGSVTVDALAGTVTVSGDHTYAVGGTFEAIIVLRDDSGGEFLTTAVFEVAGLANDEVLVETTGVVLNSATGAWVGELRVRNASALPLSGPLHVRVTNLPDGVTLTNAQGSTAEGDPFLYANVANIAPGELSAPLELVFSNPGAIALDYSVDVFAGGMAIDGGAIGGAGLASLAFESNRGQSDESVDFVARGSGYAIFLTGAGAVVALQGVDESQDSAAVRMQWVDGNNDPTVVGIDAQTGVSNYLIGDDLDAWITDVPNYARVEYRDVYEGIDLAYYGRDGALEYDWIVDPGADYGAIRMGYSGIDGLRIDASGDLILSVGDTELVQKAPYAYQRIGDVIHVVDSTFVLLDDATVGFAVGAYDPALQLIIDPVLAYSTFFGGSAHDTAQAVATDAAGNTYVAGRSASADFPLEQAFDPENALAGIFGRMDAVVVKLGADGLPIYSTYLGGRLGDEAYGLDVDAVGNVYVVGTTSAEDFPTTAGAYQEERRGTAAQGFVVGLAAGGDELLFATLDGVFGQSRVLRDVKLGADGNLYVTGITSTLGRPDGGFIAVYSGDGSARIAVRPIGGLGDTRPTSLDVDDSGAVFVAGSTEASNLATPGALQSEPRATDAFIARFDNLLADQVFATYYGGSRRDVAMDIARDRDGNLVIVGQTESADFPTHDPWQAGRLGEMDAFVLRLAPDGSAVLDATYFGGTDDDLARAVAVDANNRVVFAGQTASADFPLMRPLQSTFRGGPLGTTGPLVQDAFVAVLDLDSNDVVFSTFLGGTHADHIAAVAVGEDGMLHLAGQTRAADLRLVNAPQSGYGGNSRLFSYGDMMIVRIDPAADALPSLNAVAVNAIEGIAFDGPVAIFSDRDDDTAGDYQAVIDWGDGAVSDGTVVGADGSFTVLGQHLYERYGAYPLRVTLTDKNGTSVTASGQAVSAASGVLRYAIDVDTASLAGIEGAIRLQFNPGRGTGLAATATIAGFSGGVLLGAESLEGDVAGNLAAGLTFDNSTTLNQYTEGIRFGDTLSFTLELTGPALDPASFSLLGSSFALQLLGSDGATALLSDDTSGAVMRVDLAPAGSAQLVNLAAADTLRFGLLARANVADAPIAAQEVPIAVTEDATFTARIATFTDSNPFGSIDEFSARIDWGDGTQSQGVITETAPGAYAVAGTHRYQEAGQYALITTVTSSGGQIAVTSPGATSALAGLQAARVVVPAAAAGDLDNDGILDLVTTRVASLGRGDGSFEAPIAHGALFTEGVAVADFDGDGNLDIVGHERRASGGVLTVLLGNGDGSFSILGERATPNPQSWLLLTDDLDRDGNADLVIAAPSGYNAIPILFGNGDGSFGTTGTLTDYLMLPTPLQANVPELADVDGDGRNDLVVRGVVFGDTLVFLNQGDRTFQALPALTGFRGLAGDVSGDGIVDLVSDDGRLRIGNGDGSFGDAAPLITSSGESITSVTALADLNGDGALDLLGTATISLPQVASYSAVRTALNDGSGGFDPLTASAVYSSSLFTASTGQMRFPLLGDFNADGRVDLIDRSQVLLGLGDGTFAAARVHAAGAPGGGAQPRIVDVTSADLNLDGIADLIALNESVNDPAGLIVFLGTANGEFEPARRFDYGMVVGGNGTFNVTTADLNADGAPDVLVGFSGTSASGGLGRLSVLFGQKDGAGKATGDLGAPAVYNLSGEVRVYAVGQFNADNLPDVLIARGVANVLLRNDPSQPGRLLVPTGSIGITGSSFIHAVGDINNDGALDLVAPGGAARIHVHLGRLGTDGLPNGQFISSPVVTQLDLNALASALGDLNGDGTLDLVTMHELTSGNDLIGVRFGVGDGTFGAGVDYPVAVDAFDFSGFDDLLLQDIDGDGRLDVVAERANPDLVTVLANRGGGVFGPAITYANGAADGTGFALAVDDFNGDGANDIATANGSLNTFSVLFNASVLTGATVQETNDAPAFTTTPPNRAIAGEVYEHLLRLDDSDEDDAPEDLTLSAPTLPAWLQMIDHGDGTATLSGTPALADLGEHAVELRVTDPQGAETVLAFVITVVEGNAAPAFASSPLLAVDERAPYRYEIALTDSDTGDTPVVVAELLPSWLTLAQDASGNFVLAGEPGSGDIGVHAVTLRAIDLAGASVIQSFDITVGNVNDAPGITSAAVVEAEENQPYVYVVTAIDPDAADTLTFALTQRPRGMSIDGVSGRIDWTPDDAQVGAQRVVVRVTDAAGLFAEQNFLVAVTNVNDPPLFDSSPVTDAQSGRIYVYQPTVSDPDAFDEALLSLVEGPAGMSLDLDTGVLGWTPTRAQLGEHSIVLRAEDAAGAVAMQVFTLTVTLGNAAPAIVSQPPLLIDEQVDYLYTIEAIDEDPEDTAFTYALTLGPAGMQVDADSGAVTWQPQAGDVGVHAVSVRVVDAQGAFSEQNYLLTVENVNEGPQFASTPPGTAVVGDLYVYAAAATDPDSGDPLTFSLQDAPDDVVLLPSQGLLLWRPGSAQAGMQSITLRVADASGLSDEQTFTVEVTVAAQNLPPVAQDDSYALPANEPFVASAPGVLANDTDANGDPLTLRVLELPEHGELMLDASGGFRYVPVAGFSGEDRFVYVVNDGTADSAAATVLLDVQPVQIPIDVQLQILDFMRGPGQPVDVPAALAGGLPVTLVAEEAVQQLRLEVRYDPALLTITGAALASGLPEAANLQVDLGAPGLAVIDFESSVALPAGSIDLLRLEAEVPLGAQYAARHVFEVAPVMVNDVPTSAEPAAVLHLVGYLGDVDGDETYTSADVTGIQQMVVGLIGAFDFWTGVDPRLVADVDANGFITSRDATRVNQELAGIDRPELPPIPERDVQPVAAPAEPPESFRVAALTPGASGVHVRFNRALDPDSVAIYGDATVTADVSLWGTATGSVRGSLVLDADRLGFTFIRSADVLAADTYTLDIAGGAAGVLAIGAELLDGDADGIAGDGYRAVFQVGPHAGPLVGIADLMRGPGQPADVPATSHGIAVRLRDGGNVQSIGFDLRYDSGLFEIGSVERAANLPATAVLSVTPAGAGHIRIELDGLGGEGASASDIVRLIGRVPQDASYGTAHILDIAGVTIDGVAVAHADDDGVHVVGYLGDADRDGAYSSLDVEQLMRVIVRRDPAFAAWHAIDPVIVGDINSSGSLTALDATRLQQEVNYLTGHLATDRPEIPPLPAVPRAGTGLAMALVGTPSSAPDTMRAAAAGVEAPVASEPVAIQAQSIEAHPRRLPLEPQLQQPDVPDPIRVDWPNRGEADRTDAVRSLQAAFARTSPALAVSPHAQAPWVKGFIMGAEKAIGSSNPNHALQVLLPVAPQSAIALTAGNTG
ncbi:MAG: tandem-95 repeat protein [Betaproteobacteria bacterium]|nr:tandem-95 repeat protein [Betaproteobacteria bacterium]